MRREKASENGRRIQSITIIRKNNGVLHKFQQRFSLICTIKNCVKLTSILIFNLANLYIFRLKSRICAVFKTLFVDFTKKRTFLRRKKSTSCQLTFKAQLCYK